MKKLLLVCLLLATSCPVWAKWVKVSESDGITFYLDTATISKDGNLRKVWEIQDLQVRGERGEMSRRAEHESDCKDWRWRILSISTHSEPMAFGKVLDSSDTVSDWMSVTLESTRDAILRIVCAKK